MNFKIGLAIEIFYTFGTVHISFLYDNCKLIQKHGLTVLDSCENTGFAGLAA